MKPPRRVSNAASILGRTGGLKGGVARREKLSPERRSEIASIAGKARWANTTSEQRSALMSNASKIGWAQRGGVMEKTEEIGAVSLQGAQTSPAATARLAKQGRREHWLGWMSGLHHAGRTIMLYLLEKAVREDSARLSFWPRDVALKSHSNPTSVYLTLNRMAMRGLLSIEQKPMSYSERRRVFWIININPDLFTQYKQAWSETARTEATEAVSLPALVQTHTVKRMVLSFYLRGPLAMEGGLINALVPELRQIVEGYGGTVERYGVALMEDREGEDARERR